jgi:hypothetical protein
MAPWFRIEQVRSHDAKHRTIGGPIDKIYSAFAWSASMAAMPCPAKMMVYKFFVLPYEVWHNKLQQLDRARGG